MKRTSLIIGATLLCGLFLELSPVLGQDQDKLKERIIKNAWEAMFGDLRREDLHTIYYESYFHGREIPGKIYIRRSGQFRNESEDMTLIFDGKRAAIIDHSTVKEGEAGDLEIVDSSYLSHFEVDIALAFPAFFEYPSEYRGTARTGDAECWELCVNLPHGGHLSYFVDTTNYLVRRRLVSWDGDAEKDLWENIISGYQEYNRILFESGYSFMGQDGQEEGYYRNAKFNMEFHDSLFSIPEK